jgi:hypothetical protein
MTTDQVRDRLRAGRISKDAETSRLPQGKFRPLSDYSDFPLSVKDRSPAPSIPAEPPPRHLWIGLSLIILALTAVLAVTVYLSR